MERKQNFQWGKLELGTCYYPEHWDKSLWESDLDRMLAHGITTIRIAEFAWSLVEPQEGQFTFAFWDEFLDLAEAKGMKVIFGTPTATPPAWLTDKYPEVLNARRDGVLVPPRHAAALQLQLQKIPGAGRPGGGAAGPALRQAALHCGLAD